MSKCTSIRSVISNIDLLSVTFLVDSWSSSSHFFWSHCVNILPDQPSCLKKVSPSLLVWNQRNCLWWTPLNKHACGSAGVFRFSRQIPSGFFCWFSWRCILISRRPSVQDHMLLWLSWVIPYQPKMPFSIVYLTAWKCALQKIGWLIKIFDLAAFFKTLFRLYRDARKEEGLCFFFFLLPSLTRTSWWSCHYFSKAKVN